MPKMDSSSPLDRFPELVTWLRLAQALVLLLVAGASLFAIVLLFVIYPTGSDRSGEGAGGETTSVVLGAVALLVVLLAATLRIVALRTARRRGRDGPRPDNMTLGMAYDTMEARRLSQAWLYSSIAFAVGLDFAILLCLVGYIVGDQLFLVVMAGAIAVVMLLQIPTRRGLAAWLEQELALRTLDSVPQGSPGNS